MQLIYIGYCTLINVCHVVKACCSTWQSWTAITVDDRSYMGNMLFFEKKDNLKTKKINANFNVGDINKTYKQFSEISPSWSFHKQYLSNNIYYHKINKQALIVFVSISVLPILSISESYIARLQFISV